MFIQGSPTLTLPFPTLAAKLVALLLNSLQLLRVIFVIQSKWQNFIAVLIPWLVPPTLAHSALTVLLLLTIAFPCQMRLMA